MWDEEAKLRREKRVSERASVSFSLSLSLIDYCELDYIWRRNPCMEAKIIKVVSVRGKASRHARVLNWKSLRRTQNPMANNPLRKTKKKKKKNPTHSTVLTNV